MANRRFEMVEGGAQKFWEIDAQGASFVVRFGKLGAAGQSQTKAFASASDAAKAAAKLVAEKVRKGYVELGGAPPAQETVSEPPAASPDSPAKKKNANVKRLVKEIRATLGGVTTDLVSALFDGDENAAEDAIISVLNDGGLSWREIDVRLEHNQRPSFMAHLLRRCWELGAATLTDTVLVDRKLADVLAAHRSASGLDLAALADAQGSATAARFVRFQMHARAWGSLTPEQARDVAADLASKPTFMAFNIVVPDDNRPGWKRLEAVSGDLSLRTYLERLDPSKSWEQAFERCREGRVPTQYERAMTPVFLVDAAESVVAPISGASGVERFFNEDPADSVLAAARRGLERLKADPPTSARRSLISVLVQAAFVRCEHARLELAPHVTAQPWSEQAALVSAMRSLDVDVRAHAMRAGLIHSPTHAVLQWLDDQPSHPAYAEALAQLGARGQLSGAPADGPAATLAARAGACLAAFQVSEPPARFQIYLHVFFPNVVALQATGADMAPWVSSIRVGDDDVKYKREYQAQLKAFAAALPEALRAKLGVFVSTHQHPTIQLPLAPKATDASMVRFDLAGAPTGGDAWRGGTLANGRRVVIMLSTRDVPEWQPRLPDGATHVVLSVGSNDDVTLDVHPERPAITGGSALRLERLSPSPGAFQSDDEEHPSESDAADALIMGDGHALGGPVWRGEPLESERAFLFQLNGEASWGLPTPATYYVLNHRVVEQR